MANHRIRWNSEEKALLIGEAQDLLKRGIAHPLDALRKAQRVLPRNRRRTLLHMGQVPWFKKSSARSASPDRPAPHRSGAALGNGATGSGTQLISSSRDAIVEAVADFFREVIDRVYQVPRKGRAKARSKRSRRTN